MKHLLLTADAGGIHSIDAAVIANTGSFNTFVAFPHKSSFDMTDVGKIVLQQDVNQRYIMTNYSPPMFVKFGQNPKINVGCTYVQGQCDVTGCIDKIPLDIFGVLGTSDDTTNVAAAITYAKTHNLCVKWPSVSVTLPNGITIPDNMTIVGEGVTSRLIIPNRTGLNSPTAIILGNNCTIDGIHIIGDGGTTGTDFEKNVGIYGLSLKNEGCEASGIHLNSCCNVHIEK